MLPRGWEGVRRVLVVRLDNVGDVVLLTPALRALRQSLPEAHIALLTSPAGAQVSPLLPWIDSTVTLRALWQDASGVLPLDPERELATVAALRAGAYDAALIFTSFSQSPYPPAYACYLAGIPIRVAIAPDFGGGVLSTWVRSPDPAIHQAERNLILLRAIGFQPVDDGLELRIPDAAAGVVDAALAAGGIPPGAGFVLLAPGASAAARRYPPERFADAALRLQARLDLPLVFVGGPREQALVAPMLDQLRSARATVLSLVGSTTIPELAAVIARASVLVANDSGPMHIADALRRPSAVLYSGTELESQWAPRSAPAILLRRPTTCSPCHLFECPFGLPCLDIEPEEIVEAAAELLSAEQRRSSLPAPTPRPPMFARPPRDERGSSPTRTVPESRRTVGVPA